MERRSIIDRAWVWINKTTGRIWGRLFIAAWFLAAALVGLSGCEPQAKEESLSSSLSQAIDPIYLQNELRMQIDEFMAMISGTVTEIAAGTQDRSVRENSLRLKVRMFNVYLKIQQEDDPRLAFVYHWTAAVQLRHYLTEGGGSDLFGEAQGQVVELADLIESKVVALGLKHFSPEAIEEASPEIEALSRRFLGDASFVARPTAAMVVGKKLMSIIKLPLLPVTSLNRVSRTPEAINRFTDTADDFSLAVQQLPERFRWQMELLMMEMETSGPVMALSRELSQFETTMWEITAEIKAMPKEIRQELDQSFDALEAVQPSLRATLEDIQAVTIDAQETLSSAQAVAVQANDMAETFTITGQAFESALAEGRGLLSDIEEMRGSGEEAEANNEEGFSVEDYRLAAEQLSIAAREVRGLLKEVQEPWREDGGLRHTTNEIKGLVDMIFWRGMILVITLFALAVLYGLIRHRRWA